jgi:hypothetical protein
VAAGATSIGRDDAAFIVHERGDVRCFATRRRAKIKNAFAGLWRKDKAHSD